MLQPPGSSSGRSKPYQQRRKAQESPEQILRGLQRFGPNKRCADCNSKLPSCVNLTVGTFICISCAGIHREHNHRVKGIGHSSFTPDEAERMQNIDNDKVNKIYLARFNPGTERLRQPQDNSDLQLLRVWIKRKYHEKAWYSGEVGVVPQRPSTPNIATKHQQQQERQPQEDLLGAFNAPAPAPSNQSGGSEWDAFGGSSQNQTTLKANFASTQPQQPHLQQQGDTADFANFSSASASYLPPQEQQGFVKFEGRQQQQPQQQEGFAADFANFLSFAERERQPQQQMEYGSIGEQKQQQQQQQQQQKSGFADFIQDQPPQHHKQKQGGFANFGEQQLLQPHQQEGSFANFEQQHACQQQSPQGGLGNFEQQQPSQEVQAGFADFGLVQSTQPPNCQEQSHGGFANFGSQQKPPQQQIQQHVGFANGQQVSQQHPQHLDGFVNFDRQQLASQHHHHHHQQQQQPVEGFTSFHQLQPPPRKLGGFGNFNQQESQQHLPSDIFSNFSHQQSFPAPAQQEPSATDIFGSFGPQQPPLPRSYGNDKQQVLPRTLQEQPPSAHSQHKQPPPTNMSTEQHLAQPGGDMATFVQPKLYYQYPQTSQEQMQQSAVANLQNLASQPLLPPTQSIQFAESKSIAPAVSGEKPSSMQVDSMRSFEIPSPTRDMIAATSNAPCEVASARSQKNVTNLSRGEEVYYRNGAMTARATALKVHLDDALEPLYTVRVDGKEKQTEDSHLFVDHPLQSDIVKILECMSESQLQQVLQYAKKISYPDASAKGAGSVTPQPQISSLLFRTAGTAQPTASPPVPGISANPSAGIDQQAAPSPTPTAVMNLSMQGSPAPMPYAAPGSSAAPAPLPVCTFTSANTTGMNANQFGQSSTTCMNPLVMGKGNGDGLSMPDLILQSAASATQICPNAGQMQHHDVAPQSLVRGQMQTPHRQLQLHPPSFTPQQSEPIPIGSPMQLFASMPTTSLGQSHQHANQMPLSSQRQQEPQMHQPPQLGGTAPQGNPFDFY